jgi:hypothetical protein
MRYGLHTLLFLLAVGPPILGAAWIYHADILFSIKILAELFAWVAYAGWDELLAVLLAASTLGFAVAIIMWRLGYRHTGSPERSG